MDWGKKLKEIERTLNEVRAEWHLDSQHPTEHKNSRLATTTTTGPRLCALDATVSCFLISFPPSHTHRVSCMSGNRNSMDSRINQKKNGKDMLNISSAELQRATKRHHPLEMCESFSFVLEDLSLLLNCLHVQKADREYQQEVHSAVRSRCLEGPSDCSWLHSLNTSLVCIITKWTIAGGRFHTVSFIVSNTETHPLIKVLS